MPWEPISELPGRDLPDGITVLPPTRHKWTRPALTPARHAGRYSMYLPWRDGRLSWHIVVGYIPEMVYLSADSHQYIQVVTGPGVKSNFVDRNQHINHYTAPPPRDVVSVSRPSRDVLTPRLGLVSDKVLNVSGLVSVSAQKVSASRLGSLGPFRLDETFRAGAPCVTSVLQYKPVCLTVVRAIIPHAFASDKPRDAAQL